MKDSVSAGRVHGLGLIFAAVCVLLILVSLAGCDDRAGLDPLDEQATILAFGDSLTVGVGAAAGESYPSVLAELSGRRVENAGVSGETTAEGLRRLFGVLEHARPDLMLLFEGGNDILRGQDLAETKRNLALMIEMAREQGIEVVLIGVPEKRLFSDMAPLYEELAAEYDLTIDDGILAGLLRRPTYKSDSVHLNAEGYRVMAESIHRLLIERGALEGE